MDETRNTSKQMVATGGASSGTASGTALLPAVPAGAVADTTGDFYDPRVHQLALQMARDRTDEIIRPELAGMRLHAKALADVVERVKEDIERIREGEPAVNEAANMKLSTALKMLAELSKELTSAYRAAERMVIDQVALLRAQNNMIQLAHVAMLARRLKRDIDDGLRRLDADFVAKTEKQLADWFDAWVERRMKPKYAVRADAGSVDAGAPGGELAGARDIAARPTLDEFLAEATLFARDTGKAEHERAQKALEGLRDRIGTGFESIAQSLANGIEKGSAAPPGGGAGA